MPRRPPRSIAGIMFESRRFLITSLSGTILLLVSLIVYAMSLNYLFGAARPPGMPPIPPAAYMPAADAGPLSRDLPGRPSNIGQSLIDAESEGSVPNFLNAAKGGAAREAIAKLSRRRDVAAVNEWLQSAIPERGIGSTWYFHHGDHDFTMVGMTTLLYLFGDEPDLLYPSTIEHLFEHILIVEGGDPLYTVPRSFGLVIDTENHHLMTEGSRYLKNQWLLEHGEGGPEHDNGKNGLEQWLIAYMHEMRDMGAWEYNSIPYAGYTLHGLANIEAFAASPELSRAARHVMDLMNYRYVLGSQSLRRAPPFRRQLELEGICQFGVDPHTGWMHVWAAPAFDPDVEASARIPRRHWAFYAEIFPYRLPNDLYEWVNAKPREYFVQFGRGENGSPEIYSGGPGFVLSAGGVNRGLISRLRARETILILDDGVEETSLCFRIPGEGEDWMQWNNTGVHERFAVGPARVEPAPQYVPEAEGSGWAVYAPDTVAGLHIAAYSTDGLGIIALFPDDSRAPENLLAEILQANPAPERLHTSFAWPEGGSISYDVQAPKGVYVIREAGGLPVPRDYDRWPLIGGGAPRLTFERGSHAAAEAASAR